MNRLLITSISYSLILLLISTIFVTFFEPLHQPFVGSLQVHHSVLDYFYSGNISYLVETEMTANEISHMVDVRNLLLVAISLVLILSLAILFTWKHLTKHEKQVIRLSPYGVFLTIIVPLLFSNFSRTFFVFHELFFPQGNYSFPFNSVLIQTYSAKYFALMSLFIVVCYLLLTTVFVKKFKKNSQ